MAEDHQCEMAQRVAVLEAGHEELKIQLARNTTLTEEIHFILQSAKTFFKFAEKFGAVIRWTVLVVGGAIGIWKFFLERMK